jgi:hypothetical protein
VVFKRLISAFRAVSEEVAARGGLFGYAGHHAQKFCNVVGELPAIKQALDGFGKVVSIARIHVSNKDPSPKDSLAGIAHIFGGLTPDPVG